MSDVVRDRRPMPQRVVCAGALLAGFALVGCGLDDVSGPESALVPLTRVADAAALLPDTIRGVATLRWDAVYQGAFDARAYSEQPDIVDVDVDGQRWVLRAGRRRGPARIVLTAVGRDSAGADIEASQTLAVIGAAPGSWGIGPVFDALAALPVRDDHDAAYSPRRNADWGSSSRYAKWEDELVAALPQRADSVYAPYSCELFAITEDGRTAADVDHVVAKAEALDSGLAPERDGEFAADTLNLTIAGPVANRSRKNDRDAGGWIPSHNRGWFAAKVVAVKTKYGLSVDQRERAALRVLLTQDASRTVACP
ncbi:hypothetical protein [Candidatus Palauibacter sp.]|uniref:hypothetical protein n=1 Tax=Candidatus Palauibacter sp. TaxID=3101350 RepID=UPI003B023829